MIHTEDLQVTRDAVWKALATHPIRRAILGRERCDRLVRIAREQMADVDTSAAGEGTPNEIASRRRIEQRVQALYGEPCGMAFTTIILSWAISAVVQALVVRWWKRRQEVQS